MITNMIYNYKYFIKQKEKKKRKRKRKKTKSITDEIGNKNLDARSEAWGSEVDPVQADSRDISSVYLTKQQTVWHWGQCDQTGGRYMCFIDDYYIYTLLVDNMRKHVYAREHFTDHTYKIQT